MTTWILSLPYALVVLCLSIIRLLGAPPTLGAVVESRNPYLVSWMHLLRALSPEPWAQDDERQIISSVAPAVAATSSVCGQPQHCASQGIQRPVRLVVQRLFQQQ